MEKRTGYNVTLGFFVASGILILVISLYLIGKNQSMFGSTFHLRARFKNVNGLMAGNNIRYSGIQAGTVNKIAVINDTTIEVDLLIEEEMQPFIRDNAQVSIGNEGLMGNKVVNIIPAPIPGNPIQPGSLLRTAVAVSTDDMMNTLSSSNNNIEVISAGLVQTVNRINESKVLWQILNDTTLPGNLRTSMASLQQATANINRLSADLTAVVSDARAGKGAAGVLLADEQVADQLKQAVANINKASGETVMVLKRLDSIAALTQRGLKEGKGMAHALLDDPAMVTQVKTSLGNVEKGTAAFEQSMEALKHNFLTRGYFKKQEKRRKKDTGK
jgi:phospholipid/cholesterol/gamma-HCH transport system substrate-binding protein